MDFQNHNPLGNVATVVPAYVFPGLIPALPSK